MAFGFPLKLAMFKTRGNCYDINVNPKALGKDSKNMADSSKPRLFWLNDSGDLLGESGFLSCLL